MQAAANRLSAPKRARTAHTAGTIAALATNADTTLLEALPIAAAVITKRADARLTVLSHNQRFTDTIEQSTCTALDYADAECLKDGPITEPTDQLFSISRC